MTALSPRTRQILIAVLGALILVLVVVAGLALGSRLGADQDKEAVVVPAQQAPSAPPPSTALSSTAEKAEPPARTAVEGGRVETDTGIAILPTVTLRGDRRYVLQVSSKAGALSFSGSYSRGSIEPKIAIDAMHEFRGTTPWEQEVQAPSPDSRTWTFGVNLSTTPIGKHVVVQLWDIGPK